MADRKRRGGGSDEEIGNPPDKKRGAKGRDTGNRASEFIERVETRFERAKELLNQLKGEDARVDALISELEIHTQEITRLQNEKVIVESLSEAERKDIQRSAQEMADILSDLFDRTTALSSEIEAAKAAAGGPDVDPTESRIEGSSLILKDGDNEITIDPDKQAVLFTPPKGREGVYNIVSLDAATGMVTVKSPRGKKEYTTLPSQLKPGPEIAPVSSAPAPDVVTEKERKQKAIDAWIDKNDMHAIPPKGRILGGKGKVRYVVMGGDIKRMGGGDSTSDRYPLTQFLRSLKTFYADDIAAMGVTPEEIAEKILQHPSLDADKLHEILRGTEWEKYLPPKSVSSAPAPKPTPAGGAKPAGASGGSGTAARRSTSTPPSSSGGSTGGGAPGGAVPTGPDVDDDDDEPLTGEFRLKGELVEVGQSFLLDPDDGDDPFVVTLEAIEESRHAPGTNVLKLVSETGNARFKDESWWNRMVKEGKISREFKPTRATEGDFAGEHLTAGQEFLASKGGTEYTVKIIEIQTYPPESKRQPILYVENFSGTGEAEESVTEQEWKQARDLSTGWLKERGATGVDDYKDFKGDPKPGKIFMLRVEDPALGNFERVPVEILALGGRTNDKIYYKEKYTSRSGRREDFLPKDIWDDRVDSAQIAEATPAEITEWEANYVPQGNPQAGDYFKYTNGPDVNIYRVRERDNEKISLVDIENGQVLETPIRWWNDTYANFSRPANPTEQADWEHAYAEMERNTIPEGNPQVGDYFKHSDGTEEIILRVTSRDDEDITVRDVRTGESQPLTIRMWNEMYGQLSRPVDAAQRDAWDQLHAELLLRELPPTELSIDAMFEILPKDKMAELYNIIAEAELSGNEAAVTAAKEKVRDMLDGIPPEARTRIEQVLIDQGYDEAGRNPFEVLIEKWKGGLYEKFYAVLHTMVETAVQRALSANEELQRKQEELRHHEEEPEGNRVTKFFKKSWGFIKRQVNAWKWPGGVGLATGITLAAVLASNPFTAGAAAVGAAAGGVMTSTWVKRMQERLGWKKEMAEVNADTTLKTGIESGMVDTVKGGMNIPEHVAAVLQEVIRSGGAQTPDQIHEQALDVLVDRAHDVQDGSLEKRRELFDAQIERALYRLNIENDPAKTYTDAARKATNKSSFFERAWSTVIRGLESVSKTKWWVKDENWMKYAAGSLLSGTINASIAAAVVSVGSFGAVAKAGARFGAGMLGKGSEAYLQFPAEHEKGQREALVRADILLRHLEDANADQAATAIEQSNLEPDKKQRLKFALKRGAVGGSIALSFGMLFDFIRPAFASAWSAIGGGEKPQTLDIEETFTNPDSSRSTVDFELKPEFDRPHELPTLLDGDGQGSNHEISKPEIPPAEAKALSKLEDISWGPEETKGKGVLSFDDKLLKSSPEIRDLIIDRERMMYAASDDPKIQARHDWPEEKILQAWKTRLGEIDGKILNWGKGIHDGMYLEGVTYEPYIREDGTVGITGDEELFKEGIYKFGDTEAAAPKHTYTLDSKVVSIPGQPGGDVAHPEKAIQFTITRDDGSIQKIVGLSANLNPDGTVTIQQLDGKVDVVELNKLGFKSEVEPVYPSEAPAAPASEVAPNPETNLSTEVFQAYFEPTIAEFDGQQGYVISGVSSQRNFHGILYDQSGQRVGYIGKDNYAHMGAPKDGWPSFSKSSIDTKSPDVITDPMSKQVYYNFDTLKETPSVEVGINGKMEFKIANDGNVITYRYTGGGVPYADSAQRFIGVQGYPKYATEIRIESFKHRIENLNLLHEAKENLLAQGVGGSDARVKFLDSRIQRDMEFLAVDVNKTPEEMYTKEMLREYGFEKPASAPAVETPAPNEAGLKVSIPEGLGEWLSDVKSGEISTSGDIKGQAESLDKAFGEAVRKGDQVRQAEIIRDISNLRTRVSDSNRS